MPCISFYFGKLKAGRPAIQIYQTNVCGNFNFFLFLDLNGGEFWSFPFQQNLKIKYEDKYKEVKNYLIHIHINIQKINF